MDSPTADDKLLTALESGDFQTALPLLPKNGPLFTIGPEGFTPLHYACRHGEAEVTRLLITQYHYHIKSTSIHGQTPAHVAAKYGHVDTLRALVESTSGSECGNDTDTSTATSAPATVSDISSHGDQDGNTPLHTAAACGQLPVVQYLVHDLQCSLACTNLKSETPLHLAAKNGHLSVIKYLMDEVGCPTSPVDEYGGTPLYTATVHGQIEVVQYLVEEKTCDPNVRTTKRWEKKYTGGKYIFAPGRTPLHTASREGHLNIVHYLVNELKCDPSCRDEDGVTPLYLASQQGHLAIVKFLVNECQCDPNIAQIDGRTPLHGACWGGSQGWTPFHLASENGRLGAVHFLTKKGCDPLARNKDGNTPVSFAALRGRLDVLKFFITEKGCDPMVRGWRNRTPLHDSSQNGHLETVQYLINEHQVDPSCQDESNVTPLHLASMNGHLEVVHFLTEKDCDPLARNKHGNTPVILAALNGRLDVLKFFITKRGYDPLVRGQWNRTIVHSASQEGHLETVQYLISEHQVDPSILDENGRTALHLASMFGHLKVVEFLVEKAHCDPFQSANIPPLTFTPMWFATRHSHDDIVLYLHSKGVPVPAGYSSSEPLLDFRVSIYCIGNQSMGKSTLVKALSTEAAWFHKLQNVSGVAPETAGIVPFEFDSSIYGKVTFYDFAGHKEYYASHEVVFEKGSHLVILLTVNVSDDDETVCSVVRSWKQYLVNVVSASGCQAHVIIVGSHADLVSAKLQEKRSFVLENFEFTPLLRVLDCVLLDCRKPCSSGMSHLRELLKKTCKRIRIQSQFDYRNGGILNVFVEKYIKEEAVMTFRELLLKVLSSSESNLEPIKLPEVLYQACESLNISGHILLLEDEEVPEESWIILQKEVILSQVHGLLKHMKQSTELGIVSLSLIESLLQKHAQDLSPDLAIRYMKKMVFCSEIDPQALARIKNFPHKSVHSNERYFFLSSLVTIEEPSQVRDWNPEQSLTCTSGWYLKFANPEHIFTPRFVQVLLTELASEFALKVNPDSPGLIEPEADCIIWKNGLCWLDPHGIEVIAEVGKDRKYLKLMLKSLAKAKLQCTQLRSTLIHDILKIKRKLCAWEMELNEFFIHPLYFERTASLMDAIKSNPIEQVLIPVSNIASALLEHDHQIVITNKMSDEVPSLSIEDLLHFEPYQGIGIELVLALYNPQNEQEVVQYPVFEKLGEALHTKWKNVAIALNTSQATIEELRNDDRKPEREKCLEIFKEWSGGKGTYAALRHDLDQYSIFHGRNILQLVLESTTPSDSHGASPATADNLKSGKDIGSLLKLIDDTPLGIESLLEVRTEVASVLDHSTNLGLALGLRQEPTIHVLQQENQQDIARQFTEIIAAWLRGAGQAGTPSWRSLSKALIAPTVDCPLIARRIAEQHPSGSVSSVMESSTSDFKTQNVDSSALDTSSLGAVIDALWDLSHVWFHLGLVFGLTYGRLKAIQHNCHRAGACVAEVVFSWLSLKDQVLQQGQPSWSTLVRALTHPLVDEATLAEELADIHKVEAKNMSADLKEGQVQLQDSKQITEQQLQTELHQLEVLALQELKVSVQQHLPGVEFIHSCVIRVTGSEHTQTFRWEKRGFRIHIPGGALAESESCDIVLATIHSGSFSIPDGTVPVSTVYYVEPSRRVRKPIMLEIEHCCTRTPEMLGNLAFAFARSSTKKPPYDFECLKDGIFSEHTSYGQIEVSNFSLFGILGRISDWWRGAQSQQYSGHVLYRPDSIRNWKVLLVVTLDLTDHKEGYLEVYLKEGWMKMLATWNPVVFKEGESCLSIDIKEEGFLTSDKSWKIRPQWSPLKIQKAHVDKLQPGSCELMVDWLKVDVAPTELRQLVSLKGVSQPESFTIALNPESASQLQSPVPVHSRPTLTGDTHRFVSLNDLGHLNNVLIQVADKWLLLGVQLLPGDSGFLATLQSDFNRQSERLSKVLERWLTSTAHPTVRILADALESPSVNEAGIARTVRQHPSLGRPVFAGDRQ